MKMNFKTCIICQTSDLALFSDKSENEIFYKTAETQNAAVIALKNNFLAGDAVLRLKGSPCKNIILFGSCGGCGNVNIGDMLAINKAYNFESFTDMLGNDCASLSFPKSVTGNPPLAFGSENIISTNSACVSSLVLEKKYIDFFKASKIGAVDMESSIVISAANAIGANVLCLFYVSDSVEEPFGSTLNNDEKIKIGKARKKLSEIVLRLCDEL
jgi:purine-nucleoside phosphorylase